MKTIGLIASLLLVSPFVFGQTIIPMSIPPRIKIFSNYQNFPLHSITNWILFCIFAEQN